ncbi:IS3 family transposase [Pseudotamlana carrageenivorans]|uniref:IS3 family transposase n=1 Tax=Pseudotamlana carrageenivorans TaxID=2069432 RepID=A0A2I7SDT7_9FLAO|nr:IS3 family transposase [Tamlana carrageenivorans]AUS04050.1 IS3 family transposase [Tamlana carrageenivorans]
MGKKYDNEFKSMILDLSKSGIPTKQLSEEYGVHTSVINRWKQEYDLKGGDFSKNEPKSKEHQELIALKKELRDVKMERDNLKKGGEHLFQERQIRYNFILSNKNTYPVEKMCKCMKVSKNAYYHWLKTKDTLKVNSSKSFLKDRIEAIFDNSKQIYGSYRIQKQLEREKLFYSRSYVGLLMKEMGLRSVLNKKFVVTTDSNHSLKTAKNELDRDFTSFSLGYKLVSDITYIRVNQQWNYLTTIMDLADRKIIGWSLSEDMTTENTVLKAWVDARRNRVINQQCIFHSDRGVQYASNRITNMFFFNQKVIQSMSRKGNCWDNAVAESFFKTIKYEWINRFKYTSYNQLYKSIDQYLNWYNTQRLHSSLGYMTPLEKELQLKGFINKAA